ncbi:hypothetical protein TWF970_004610 [Orbilia oligospora]|uniref:Uncharacterized protein n=1 Tax=Orbilia oligospora TaxID=2813651 RepID=A0A7C8VM35_ORBOL|nr:hypothetical protein TWF970_004610 [Orbilia oligospora]
MAGEEAHKLAVLAQKAYWTPRPGSPSWQPVWSSNVRARTKRKQAVLLELLPGNSSPKGLWRQCVCLSHTLKPDQAKTKRMTRTFGSACL